MHSVMHSQSHTGTATFTHMHNHRHKSHTMPTDTHILKQAHMSTHDNTHMCPLTQTHRDKLTHFQTHTYIYTHIHTFKYYTHTEMLILTTLSNIHTTLTQTHRDSHRDTQRNIQQHNRIGTQPHLETHKVSPTLRHTHQILTYSYTNTHSHTC